MVTKDTIGRDEVMVRARQYDDLERLLNILGIEKRIYITPHDDYLCRVILPKEEWVRYVANTAQQIDYSNFKDASCQDDDDRYHAYSGVWLALRSWQMESDLANVFRARSSKD